MSRTRRTAWGRVPVKTTIAKDQRTCCPEGRDCGWCADSRTHTNKVRATVAAEKVQEAYA